MTIIVKDSKVRHGNCVPFVLNDTKLGTIKYFASLNELCGKLKIDHKKAYYIRKSGQKYQNRYTIKRMEFSNNLDLS